MQGSCSTATEASAGEDSFVVPECAVSQRRRALYVGHSASRSGEVVADHAIVDGGISSLIEDAAAEAAGEIARVCKTG